MRITQKQLEETGAGPVPRNGSITMNNFSMMNESMTMFGMMRSNDIQGSLDHKILGLLYTNRAALGNSRRG